MEKIIRALNLAINAIEIAVDAIIKVLDRTIIAIQRVSREIISLLLSIFRLLFYLLPFVLLVIIGLSKDWTLLYAVGGIILLFTATLFIRDILEVFREDDIKEEKEKKSEKAGRVIITILILNIVTVGYAALYYLFDISIEQLGNSIIQPYIGIFGMTPLTNKGWS